MADKEVESTPVVDDKEEKEPSDLPTDEDSKDEDEKKSEVENGDAKYENGKDEQNGHPAEPEVVCPVKRKSAAGGDAPDAAPAEGVSPEKKAKLDDADAESNGDAEVAA